MTDKAKFSILRLVLFTSLFIFTLSNTPGQAQTRKYTPSSRVSSGNSPSRPGGRRGPDKTGGLSTRHRPDTQDVAGEQGIDEQGLEESPPVEWTVPMQIKAVAGDSYVGLSWKVDLGRKEAREIEGYLIRYGEFSGQDIIELDVGKLQARKMRNLVNKITYSFEVTAYDQYGNLSKPSEQVEATPLPQDELMSDIERMIARDIPEEVSTKLKQFGYDLFSSEVSTFAPVDNVPVGPDYIIGPGDAFIIYLWGKVEATYPVTVDRDGKIHIPEVGAINVWGLTFSEMKKLLQAEIAKFTPDFQMNVTMQQLRTIQVFVVGNVRVPGNYSLSSLSTMLNSLFACGGPTKNGTLRKIQLLRNGKVVNTLDLYNFLLKGDKSQDVRLRPGDTIFVPIIGKVVGIAGNVKKPAIYEMGEKLTIKELLDMAGGVLPVGYLQRVQLERITAHKKKIVVDVNLSLDDSQDPSQWNTPLHDGDTVKIHPVLPLTEDIVYLEGHVKRADGYEVKKGMRISDLIGSFDDLQSEPHLEYAELIRLEEPDLHEVVIPFNLGEVLKKNPKHDLKLQKFDRVKVYSKTDFEDKYNVTIIGNVRRPGKYKLFEDMTVKNLIENAGGVLDNTYLDNAELTRQIIDKGKKITTRQINININDAMAGDKKNNIPLKKYDTLRINVIPEWRIEQTVIIEGEVLFPGEYPLSKGEKLSSLIKRAGGYTDHAYHRGVVFTRKSTKEVQQKRLENLISKMEIEIQSTTALMSGGALDREDLEGARQALTTQQELLQKLRNAEITGRVVIKLQPLNMLTGSKYDIELEEGDLLIIPERPGVVQVLGAVYNATALLYEADRTIDFYLNKVGGATKNADIDEIYLVKADGSVISRSQEGWLGLSWDDENNRWATGGFMATKVQRGDVILVPRELDKTRWLKTTSDLIKIIYQTAVSTGVLVALF